MRQRCCREHVLHLPRPSRLFICGRCRLDELKCRIIPGEGGSARMLPVVGVQLIAKLLMSRTTLRGIWSTIPLPGAEAARAEVRLLGSHLTGF